MKKIKGFTLVELLIIVAVSGIIATIAYAQMLDALHRTKQKESTIQIKHLATAIMGFGDIYRGFPNVTHDGDIDPVNFAGLPAFADCDGSNILVPDQLLAYPAGDGWNTFYEYRGTPPDAYARQWPRLNDEQCGTHFIVASKGSDRIESVGAAGGDQGGNTSTITQMATTWCIASDLGIASNHNLGNNTELHCFETDIIWGDSSFLQVPQGRQKLCN